MGRFCTGMLHPELLNSGYSMLLLISCTPPWGGVRGGEKSLLPGQMHLYAIALPRLLFLLAEQVQIFLKMRDNEIYWGIHCSDKWLQEG